MRHTARAAGIIWIGLVVAFGLWMGYREMNGAPGLVFRNGFGELWLFALVALPGYLLYRWAAKGPAGRVNVDR